MSSKIDFNYFENLISEENKKKEKMDVNKKKCEHKNIKQLKEGILCLECSEIINDI